MYSKLPNLVLGFHGCDKEVFDRVINKGETLKKSENSYDWLGHGIYFWEHNYQRALDWAKRSSKIKDPAVLGAVIDLGCCLNLTDNSSEEWLKRGYALLKARCDILGIELPRNRPSKKTTDVLLRDLDCAVIQQIHDICKKSDSPAVPVFDSVRGIFVEGEAPYPGSEFRAKTHVQLCVVNPNCIKGYFRPLPPDGDYPIP